MAQRYRTTFQLFGTEELAKSFCEAENRNSYIRKHHPAHYAPWTSQNGKERKFVAWYATK